MDEPLSKTQKKKEAQRLQALGVALMDLDEKILADFPLTPALSLAIKQALTLKSHGAKRRQAQLIGKLMRAADAVEIENKLSALKAESDGQTTYFHQLEQLREQLLTGDKAALTAVVSAHPTVDVQHLRLLIKKAIQEKTDPKLAGASKALFRFLRSLS